MAGLGALIFGILLGGSAIGAAIDNAQMMSKPQRYLDDGTPVYIDRKCKQHINGEKVVQQWTHDAHGNIKIVDVGERSGRVYFDPEEATKKRLDATSEKYRQEAIENGKLAYLGYCHKRKRRLTCEVSTGKFIAKLQGREDGTYWKYYLPDSEMICFSSPAKNDPGVQITQEEYDKLNIFVGATHYASDLYRYKYVYKNGKCEVIPR